MTISAVTTDHTAKGKLISSRRSAWAIVRALPETSTTLMRSQRLPTV
jgi:hypothetical protein